VHYYNIVVHAVVQRLCKSCNFDIRALHHIRRHISENAAKTIACSMVNGRLDYCNSLLHLTSSSNINKLKRVQNSVSRIITRRTTSHLFLQISTGCQFSTASMQYKLAVITFKFLTTQEPSYQHDLIRSDASTRQLRSDGQGLLQSTELSQYSLNELSAIPHS